MSKEPTIIYGEIKCWVCGTEEDLCEEVYTVTRTHKITKEVEIEDTYICIKCAERISKTN